MIAAAIYYKDNYMYNWNWYAVPADLWVIYHDQLYPFPGCRRRPISNRQTVPGRKFINVVLQPPQAAALWQQGQEIHGPFSTKEDLRAYARRLKSEGRRMLLVGPTR